MSSYTFKIIRINFRIIRNFKKGYKVAVIVNDIGEVNIDATLIAKGAGIVEEDKDSLVPLRKQMPSARPGNLFTHS